MSFNISYIFKAVDNFTAPARKIARSLDPINAKVKRVSASVKRMGDNMAGIGARMSATVTAPLALVAGFALKASAEMETLQVSFETMLGSAEKAKVLVKGLTKFAASTPFQIADIGKASKQLLAFGVAGDEVLGKLKFLGDISAGANVPLGDMAAIFGKVKAKGKAMTEELLQLSDRGVPIIDILSKGFGVTGEQIFKMASKGQISFGVMEKALKSMASKGGLFFNQMQRQSGTLGGLFSTLKDNVNIALAKIGDTLVETFDIKGNIKKFIEMIGKLTQKFQDFVKNNPKLAKIILIIAAVVAGLAPLLVVVGLLTAAVGGLGAVFATVFSPVTLIVAAIAGLVALGVFLYKKYKPFRDLILGIFSVIKFAFNGLILLAKTIASGISSVFEGMGVSTSDALEGVSSVIGKIGEGIRAISPIVKVLATAVKDVFFFLGDLIAKIAFGIRQAIEGITGFIDGISSKIQSVKDLFGSSSVTVNAAGAAGSAKSIQTDKLSAMGAGLFGFAPQQNSRAQVDININDRNRIVESIQTKATGSIFESLNVGQNMVGQ
jgi:tape measure domain-containing protein